MKIKFKLSDTIVKLKCIAQNPMSYITCNHSMAVCGKFFCLQEVEIEPLKSSEEEQEQL